MIILHHEYGQLANRMIIIIHFVSYCIDRKQQLSIANFSDYIKCFDNESLNSFKHSGIKFKKKNNFLKAFLSIGYRLKNKTNLFQVVDIREAYDYKEKTYPIESLDSIIKKTNYIIPEGWLFRSQSLTSKYHNQVSSIFKPNIDARKNISNFLKSIPKDHMKVGVHIRRGDYKEYLDGKYYYDDETYISLIKHLQMVFRSKEVSFLIFSNEKVAGEIHQMESAYISNASFIEDFFLLSKCDYLIGPPSTFSLVSAYLGKKPLHHIVNPSSKPNLEDFKLITNL